MDDFYEADDPGRVADELLAEYGAGTPALVAERLNTSMDLRSNRQEIDFWAMVYMIAKARLAGAGAPDHPSAATA